MIENLKDLKALLKLCRQNGVTEINLGTVALKLGEMPVKPLEQSIEDDAEDIYESFPDWVPSAEELTFFANGGNPEENPYRKVIDS